MGFADKESAILSIDKFSFPVIIKPVDSSGSKGATVLKSKDGFEKAVEFAFSFSRGNRIVIEEFIEKIILILLVEIFSFQMGEL